MKTTFKNVWPLVVSGCILTGSVIGYFNQKKEGEKANPFINPAVRNMQQETSVPVYHDYEQYNTYFNDNNTYVEDYWYPRGEIKNDTKIDNLTVEDFQREVGSFTNCSAKLVNGADQGCSKRTYTRYNEETGEVLNKEVQYCVGENVICSSKYECVRVYRDRSTGYEYTYYLDESIPMSIIDSCDFVEIRKNKETINTFVEGSNSTIYVDGNYTHINSYVGVGRDEFFRFLKDEDEFIYSYFGYKPDDISSEVQYQNPNRNYVYDYYTVLDNNANLLLDENMYYCDDELFFGKGYDYRKSDSFTEGSYSDIYTYVY